MIDNKNNPAELLDEEQLEQVSGGFNLSFAPLKPKDRFLVNLKCNLCGGSNLFTTKTRVSEPVEGVCIVCGKQATLTPYEIG